MKFVHIADMHFDIPFTTLNQKELGMKRRLDQRTVFKKVIKYCKENSIDMLFICGDLYEHDYVKQSTIEYINSLFLEIPNTQIYMVPGNHDPILKHSYYQEFSWSQNVFIYGDTIEKKETKEADIYGFGFSEFYRKNMNIKEIKIEQPDKINILLTHGSVDSGKEEDRQYNPMSKKELKSLDFDYIGLGHIHKPSYQEENQTIIYPGSPISLGFDELGKHGMIVGEITKEQGVKIQFVPLDDKEFVEQEFLVDEITSKEALIEAINAMPLQENYYYKIILTGRRNFEIEITNMMSYIQANNIIKLKDETTLKIDLEELAKQQTLRGIFVKNMLEELKQKPENKEQIEKIIEIGLEAM